MLDQIHLALANLALQESYMYEILNKYYLQNFSQMSAILRDESNEPN